MPDTPRRGYQRTTREHTYCQLDDVEPQFEVVEISADGFSFACDCADNRFQMNVVLSDISILNSESQEIIHAAGVIRHRSGFDARRDRVGVSFNSKRFDNTITGRVRLPRRRPSIELGVSLTLGNSVTTGLVVDYNVCSARLSLNNPIPAKSGDKVQIAFGTTNQRLYDGGGIVVRSQQGNAEIVVEFSDNLLELRQVSITEKAMFGGQIIEDRCKQLDVFESVSPEFKVLVSEWRMYLEMVEEVLDREEAKGFVVSREDERFYLEQIIPDVSKRLRAFMVELNRIAPTIDPEEAPLYKELLRSRLERFFRRSPIACSIMDKMHGYHGDFETVKQFFADPLVGAGLFGKLFNQFVLSLEPVTAHVARIAYIYDQILERCESSDHGIRVLSLGSGPAEEILRLVQNYDLYKPIHIALIDMDAHALADFYERVQSLQKTNVEIELVNFNVIDILVGKTTDLTPQSYDITYCAGMFDYFKDRFCRKFIKFMIDLTAEGGHFIYTNVHSRNFARYFMEYCGGWNIYHRNEEETLALAPESDLCEASTDKTGTNVFIKGTRLSRAVESEQRSQPTIIRSQIHEPVHADPGIAR